MTDHIIPHRLTALSLRHKLTTEAVKRLIIQIMELIIQTIISKLPPPSAPSEKNLNVLDVIMEKAIMDLGFSDFNKSLRLFDPATKG